MMEVGGIRREADWQALEDRCRQFGRCAAPVFLGVTFEEHLIKFPSDRRKRLLLEVAWRMVEANCASREVSLGLRGCKIPSKKGAERAEIDRQREQASVDTGVHLVFERLKSCETLHQFPD